MTINEKQNQLIDEFSLIQDWLDRYQLIIDLGDQLPPMPEELKKPENLIKGCQSRVWIADSYNNGKLHFVVDSDALITKGIAALIVNLYNDHTPQEIIDTPPYLLDRIGLKENLSLNRANGLSAMVEHVLQAAKKRLNNTLQ